MAENATLARPYANAAFALAEGQRRLPEWSQALGQLAAAVRTSEVSALIGAPALSSEVKAHRLAEVVGDALDDRGRRFVRVLADNGRLGLLPEIAAHFDARKAEAERVLDVEITAAVALSAEQRQAFAAGLRKRFNQDVQVAATVDASLLGGAVIRAGDTVVDGSVRGRLRRLVVALQRA